MSAIGTKTLIILLIMGVVYGRVDMFLDISMVYALLNFIGCVVLAKYLETTGEVE
jgi:multicomponent Na+:H+ antiporter subunit F